MPGVLVSSRVCFPAGAGPNGLDPVKGKNSDPPRLHAGPPGQSGHDGPNEAGCTVAPDNLRRDAVRERITPGLRHACGVGNKKQDISSESSNGYTYARVKLNVVTTLVRVSRVFITGLRSENEPPAARPPHRRRGSGQVLRWPGPARRSRPMTRSALRSRHWRHRRPPPSPPPR